MVGCIALEGLGTPTDLWGVVEEVEWLHLRCPLLVGKDGSGRSGWPLRSAIRKK